MFLINLAISIGEVFKIFNSGIPSLRSNTGGVKATLKLVDVLLVVVVVVVEVVFVDVVTLMLMLLFGQHQRII